MTLDLLRVVKYLSGEREDSARNVPLLFVASPSAKDPTWEERSPGEEAGPKPSRPVAGASLLSSSSGKSTLSLVTFANYKWFEEWKDGKVSNRGAEYKELKQAFINSILEVVMGVFPNITTDKVTFVPPRRGRRQLARFGLSP